MFKKKSAMKGTTKDNIKFHMEEIQLRKMKLTENVVLHKLINIGIYIGMIFTKKKKEKKRFLTTI